MKKAMKEENKPTFSQRLHNRGTEIAKNVPQGLETGLPNYWYPVLESEKLTAEGPLAFKVLDKNLVAWRDAEGKPRIVRDKCPHRAARLSQGLVIDGALQCPWHGLRFSGGGNCVFIPWEVDDSPLLQKLHVQWYPCEEVGGYVWGYIGDTDRFPVPPLTDSIPEEFFHPEKYVIFRHPSEVWQCNWLQTLDGVDGYHAIILHSRSQAVASDTWRGGQAKASEVKDRRMKIVETKKGYRGIALDRDGNRIHHGHLLDDWRGERFVLPGLHSLLLVPAPGSSPFASRHYQIAVDKEHTLSVRFVTMRAETAEDHSRCKELWHDVISPRQRRVSREDQAILENLGTLEESREDEFLLQPDVDIVNIRRQVAEAFRAQAAGSRLDPVREALVCPV